jgi:hypothetical protein
LAVILTVKIILDTCSSFWRIHKKKTAHVTSAPGRST